MKKKIVALLLIVVLAVTSVVGGTMAYLTDEEANVNVAVVGNVNVELNEQQRNDDRTALEPFEDGKTANPIVDSTSEKDDMGMPKSENYVDKIVYATNTGINDAYIRILVAIPTWANTTDYTKSAENNLHWNYPNDANMAKLQTAIGGEFSADSYTDWTLTGPTDPETDVVDIDGETYWVYTFTMKDAVKPGQHTPIVMTGFYLDSRVDYDVNKGVYLDVAGEELEGFDGTIYIPVYVQAVQAAGFTDVDAAFTAAAMPANPWADAKKVATQDELNEVLTAGGYAVLTDDLEVDAGSANYVFVQNNGGTIDGAGHTLTLTGPDDYYGILTSGGTIRDLTIDDGFRAIYLSDMTENVNLKNVKIGGEGVCYAINTGVNTGEYSLIVSDSEIYGWTSFAQIKSASFTNCVFGQGEYYDTVDGRVLKPYVNTTVTGCSFVNNYYLDLSALEEGCTVTLTDCTVNGDKLTATIVTASHDWTDYEGVTFYVELPSWATSLADCVIFG